MKHITEIVPELSTMPEWAEKAFKEGQFFTVALARVAELERNTTDDGGTMERIQARRIAKLEKQLESCRCLVALYFEGCPADTFDDAVRLVQTQIGESNV